MAAATVYIVYVGQPVVVWQQHFLAIVAHAYILKEERAPACCLRLYELLYVLWQLRALYVIGAVSILIAARYAQVVAQHLAIAFLARQFGVAQYLEYRHLSSVQVAKFHVRPLLRVGVCRQQQGYGQQQNRAGKCAFHTKYLPKDIQLAENLKL